MCTAVAGIFLSYRRGPSSGWALHLADELRQAFGETTVFHDLESIEAGTDFVTTIEEAVASCAVLLAVISPDWLTATTKEGRRRLDEPRDFVRLEIEAALKRNVRVIPILVGGAAMPSESDLPESLSALSRRQAHELSDSRWDFDVNRLVDVLKKIVPPVPPPSPPGEPRPRSVRRSLIAGAGALVLAIVAVLLYRSWDPTPTPPRPAQRRTAEPVEPTARSTASDARQADAVRRVRAAAARGEAARRRIQEAGAVTPEVDRAMLALREAITAVEGGDLGGVRRAEQAVAVLGRVAMQAESDCREGYVWRRAFVGDRVCVTAETYTQVTEDNRLAAERREPGGGRYGPDTCRQGFVWRDAGPGDHVCVPPDRRDQAARDNRAAASRRR